MFYKNRRRAVFTLSNTIPCSVRRINICILGLFLMHLLTARTAIASDPLGQKSENSRVFYLAYKEGRVAQSCKVSLYDKKMEFTGEPAYSGKDVVRSYLPIGGSEENYFCFAWDSGGDWRTQKLYIDENHNGDLSDDPHGMLDLGWNHDGFVFVDIRMETRGTPVPLQYLFSMRPYRDMGRGPVYCRVYFHSAWYGDIRIEGGRWQVAVVDNLDGIIGKGDLLILGKYGGKDEDLACSVEAFRFPYPEKLFLKDSLYDLEAGFIPGKDHSRLALGLSESGASLGELILEGRNIKRLVLQCEAGRRSVPVILDHPGQRVLVPEGTYSRQRIYMDGGDSCGLLYAECYDDLTVASDKPAHLRYGGPLNNTVDIRRKGSSFEWRYGIEGIGGERYFEFANRGGPRVMVFNRVDEKGNGYCSFTSPNPPKFTLYHDNEKLVSHEIGKPEEVLGTGETSVVDYIPPQHDGSGDKPREPNIVKDKIIVRNHKVRELPRIWDLMKLAVKQGPIVGDVSVTDEMISYKHEMMESYDYTLESESRIYSWTPTGSAPRKLRIVASRDIGDLGPEAGKPVAIEIEKKAVEKTKEEKIYEYVIPFPSLTIFKESRMWKVMYMVSEINDPLEAEDIKALREYCRKMNKVSKQTSETMEKMELTEPDEDPTPARDFNYSMLPYVFYGIRHLYAKETWSEEEVRLGKVVGGLFAGMTGNKNLAFHETDPESFRAGLVKMTKWFEALCEDNRVLANMINTMDDGPFYGEDADHVDLIGAEEVGAAELLSEDGKLMLYRTGSDNNPMVLQHVNKDGKVVWQKRLTSSSGGIDSASFATKKSDNKSFTTLGGMGYKIHMYVDWAFGYEYCHLYLDGKCRLRFYYLGW